jgi:hypothetical protein
MRRSGQLSAIPRKETTVQLLERIANTQATAEVLAVANRMLERRTGRATLCLPGAEHYVSYSRTVPGWFSATDFRLFDFVLGRQLTEAIRGDILEIGCYQGRSTILLGYALRADDRLVVCDLFGANPDDVGAPQEGLAAYDGLTVDRFYHHYGRFHRGRPQVEICPSTQLRDRLAGRSFRFLHIDGSHAYDSVCADISFAVKHSAERAVVVLDDYRSPHTPGVSAAAWEAVAAGLLYPFCISEMKLYATFSADEHAQWMTACARLGTDRTWECEVHEVRGRGLVRLRYRSRIPS